MLVRRRHRFQISGGGFGATNLFARRWRAKDWAHQDSNLGQAGYEPAALTAELWAHTDFKGIREKGKGKREKVRGKGLVLVPFPLSLVPFKFFPRETLAASATVTGAAAS